MKSSGGIGTIAQYVKTASSFLKHLLNNRPKVFWWSMAQQKGFTKENFGDILTPYLIEKLTGKKPVLFSPKSKFARYFPHSLMVGSIISQSQPTTLVWGSGIISKNDEVIGGKFLAVRGPKTGERLCSLGFADPKVYGDPAILLPLLYHPKVRKNYKTGLISHYVDTEATSAEASKIPGVKHIELLTENIESVIDQILECERIISSSLHGVIVAQSYGIPALWWRYSDKLAGDDIKFYDYFESVGLINVGNNENSSITSLIEHGVFLVPDAILIEELQQGLLKSFPYKISLSPLNPR